MTDATALPTPDRSTRSAILWACFLASSWTWVLGMLFPILLVRDFGFWGWLAFLVPNAAGAAAMGFVLASPEQSRQVTERHQQACIRFSEVTLAFHVFAVGWLYWLLFGPWAVLAAAAIALVVLVAWGQKLTLLRSATIVTVLSLAALVGWVILGQPRSPGLRLEGEAAFGLLMLFPALAIGLFLCPYLDLTFHRARQYTAGPAGKRAFFLGFALIFPLMIVFSLLYAPALVGFFHDPWNPNIDLTVPALWLLTIHLIAQAGFTIALHVREIAVRAGHQGLHRVFILAIAAGALAFWALTERELQHGMVAGELIYRVFILFYGLVFPAYVWLCMIPAPRRPRRGPRLAIFLATVLISLPPAYLGFVLGQTYLIPVALTLLALGRIPIHLLPAAQTSDDSG